MEVPGRGTEEPLVPPPLFTVVQFPLFTVFLWEAGQSGPTVLFRQSGESHKRVSDRPRTLTQVLLFGWWLCCLKGKLTTRKCNRVEKAMAPHSSTLAWRTPGTGEPGGLLSMGSHRVVHD